MNNFEIPNTEDVAESEVEKLTRMKEKLQAWISPEDDPEEASVRLGARDNRLSTLRSEFPDYRLYDAYFILEGQMPPANTKHFDFPGKYSVEQWVDERSV